MSRPAEKAAPSFPRPWTRTLDALPDEDAWRRFLDGLEAHLEELYAHGEHASYLLYRDKVNPDLDELNAMARAVWADRRLFELVAEARGRYPGELGRRTELLGHVLLRERVKARPAVQRLGLEISKLFVHHEPSLPDGRRGKGVLARSVRTSDDRALREAAWRAIHAVGDEAAPLIRELAEHRNAAARDLGFASWNELVFPTYGLTKGEVDETFARLVSRLGPLYDRVRTRLAEAVGLDEIRPWDLDWARDRILAPPAELFGADEAIPALDGVLERIGARRDGGDVPLTVAEIPLGGACFDIHIPADLRILVNPREGLLFRWVLFHEYGHALHHASNAQGCYTLQRGDPSALREGMADLLATFATEPPALVANLGDEEKARAWWGRVEIRRIFDLFRQIMQARTENALYEMDAPEHEQAYLDASRELAIGIPGDAPRSWAVRITLAEHPNYMQDYVFAQMVAAQCREAMDERGLEGAAIMPALRADLYGPGASRPWREKVATFCGRPLSEDALCRRFERAWAAW